MYCKLLPGSLILSYSLDLWVLPHSILNSDPLSCIVRSRLFSDETFFSIFSFSSFSLAIFLPYVMCVSFAVDLSLAVCMREFDPWDRDGNLYRDFGFSGHFKFIITWNPILSLRLFELNNHKFDLRLRSRFVIRPPPHFRVCVLRILSNETLFPLALTETACSLSLGFLDLPMRLSLWADWVFVEGVLFVLLLL